jgi:L,D-transpeptidase catalytic domain
LYDAINLQQYGLSKEAFTYAYKGYQYLLAKKWISCSDYLTICDFSQSSRQKRFYLIDIANSKLVLNTYVAHGRKSGGEYATRFSNKPTSMQSSLGFYITQSIYTGEHGLSLKINGVDAGFNDKASRRHIVIHGAEYIDENWLQRSPYMGRSYGCPAVPQNESATIINTIKNGTCLFIYHPNRNYLLGSKILND